MELSKIDLAIARAEGKLDALRELRGMVAEDVVAVPTKPVAIANGKPKYTPPKSHREPSPNGRITAEAKDELRRKVVKLYDGGAPGGATGGE